MPSSPIFAVVASQSMRVPDFVPGLGREFGVNGMQAFTELRAVFG
jgi:hypothetical protein